LALRHNHALAALRTTIQQSMAEEITANLRTASTPASLPDKIAGILVSKEEILMGL
jgi:hypothetical protein